MSSANSAPNNLGSLLKYGEHELDPDQSPSLLEVHFKSLVEDEAKRTLRLVDSIGRVIPFVLDDYSDQYDDEIPLTADGEVDLAEVPDSASFSGKVIGKTPTREFTYAWLDVSTDSDPPVHSLDVSQDIQLL